MKTPIKNFYGKILGYIETKSNGDKIATSFYGKILGYYYKDRDVTTDFYGRIVSKGDTLSALIYQESVGSN